MGEELTVSKRTAEAELRISSHISKYSINFKTLFIHKKNVAKSWTETGPSKSLLMFTVHRSLSVAGPGVHQTK